MQANSGRKRSIIEAREGERLGALDVHRQEVDFGNPVLLEQASESDGRHLDLFEREVNSRGAFQQLPNGRYTRELRAIEWLYAIVVVGDKVIEELAFRTPPLPALLIFRQCIEGNARPAQMLLEVVSIAGLRGFVWVENVISG